MFTFSDSTHILQSIAEAFTTAGYDMVYSIDGKIRSPLADGRRPTDQIDGIVYASVPENDCQRIIASNNIVLNDEALQGTNGMIEVRSAIIYVLTESPKTAILELKSTLQAVLAENGSAVKASMPVEFGNIRFYKFDPVNDTINETANFFEFTPGHGAWIAEQELFISAELIE